MKKNAAAMWGDIARFDTLPKMLRANAAAHGDEVALREKEFGIWNALTWREFYQSVSRLALAFQEKGIKRGEVVALLGANGPYWLIAALAVHTNRALSLGVYGDALAAEVGEQIARAGVAAVVCEDEEQVDKILAAPGDARLIVYKDKRGMHKYDDARLAFLGDLFARGEALEKDSQSAADEMIDATKASDPALLISTSGTTAAPKFAEIDHRAFMRHTVKYLRRDPKTAADEYLSILPLPWVMETKYALGKGLIARMKINFAESADTQMADLREIGPTFLLLSPRAWEQIAAGVRAKMLESTPLKRALFHFGLKIGIAAVKRGKKSVLAEWILFRPLRDSLGFSRLASAATGGAALGPDTYRFFIALGIPLRQLYGQTELLGAYTIHPPDEIDFETSGTAFEDVEIKIASPDPEGLGKIMTRHDCMMRGYFHDPQASAAAFDKEGWMDTGDAGYLRADGHLVVVDRFKDLAATDAGFRFSPQFLENKLKFSPYIAEAVVVGDKRPWLAALVCIRFEVVAKWAERKRLSYTGYTDLAAKEEVRDLILQEIAAVNRAVLPAQKIRRVVLLYKELDADDGELTRTRKVRRSVVAERYADIINAIYKGEKEIKIDAEITLADGGKQRVRTTLAIAGADFDAA
jgi:long-chain acyl-CoA synthetase